MEEMASAGWDTTALDDEAFNTEAAQDRCILRLIASCCNGELVQSKPYSRTCKLDLSFSCIDLFKSLMMN